MVYSVVALFFCVVFILLLHDLMLPAVLSLYVSYNGIFCLVSFVYLLCVYMSQFCIIYLLLRVVFHYLLITCALSGFILSIIYFGLIDMFVMRVFFVVLDLVYFSGLCCLHNCNSCLYSNARCFDAFDRFACFLR